MKRFFALAIVAIASVFASNNTSVAEDKKDIVATAVAAEFKTLVTAVKAAGLVETLQGKGPFTVFAPTDEAFKKLPEETLKAVLADKEKLTKILMAHVVVGKSVMAADVVKLNGEKVNGFKVVVADGKVKLGTANVIKTDVAATNGVIHVIDTVLIPE